MPSTTEKKIEKFVKYAADVDSLTDAWAFVMNYVDKVGSAPSIKIKPYWIVSEDMMGEELHTDEMPQRFTVVVCGMTEIDYKKE